MIAPELHALRGDIQRLEQKIDGVDQRLTQKIDGVDGRLTVKIDSLRTEIVSMKAEVLAEIRRLDTKMWGGMFDSSFSDARDRPAGSRAGERNNFTRDGRDDRR